MAGREKAGVPAEERAHEDLAVFTRVGTYLEELEAETARRAEQRGAHGRRFARLRTAIEDALLQARQGVHEAQHGQGG